MLLCAAPLTMAEDGESEEVKTGDYVQMGAYYGEPILWRCVSIDEGNMKEGSDIPYISYPQKENKSNPLPLMLSDEILCLKAFDADAVADKTQGSHERRDSGKSSNYWKDSNIRSWLNSEAGTGEVDWLCKNPPAEEGVWSGYNAYDNEAGFLTNFTAAELNSIQNVMQKSIVEYPEYKNGVYTDKEDIIRYLRPHIDSNKTQTTYEYSEQVEDRMFLLSEEQAETVSDNIKESGYDYRTGVLSKQCAARSDYTNNRLKAGKDWEYWLRTPMESGANTVKTVRIIEKEFDDIYNAIASYGTKGVRPAFYLKNGVQIASGSGTKEDPYILGMNAPLEPTASPEPPVSPEPTIEAASSAEATFSPEETVSPKPEQTLKPTSAPLPEKSDFITADWAAAAVKEAYDEGLIPEQLADADLTDNISRGEFAAIAVKLYEKIAQVPLINEEDEEFAYQNSFTDISFSEYFGDILKAYHYGIVSGISETEFAPKAQITREQMAAMLYRVYTKAQPDTADFSADYTNLFADDAQISEYAREAVYYMANKNIINGVGDNTFAPNGSNGAATREQAAVIALRCIKSNL